MESEERELVVRNGGRNGLDRDRAERGGGGGSGGSNSSWGHYQTTSPSNNQHINHHDDSGHSSGGEGGIMSGGERTNGSADIMGGSLTKNHQRELANHSTDTMTASQYSAHFANDGKHSLLQFALKYFRMAKEQNLVAADGTLQTNKDKNKKKKNNKDPAASWTWKDQVTIHSIH